MNQARLFGDGILTSAMAATQYDRRKIQVFMEGLELTYYSLKGYHSSIPTYEKKWKTRLDHVRSKMEDIYHQLMAQYQRHVPTVDEEFMTGNPKDVLNKMLLPMPYTTVLWNNISREIGSLLFIITLQVVIHIGLVGVMESENLDPMVKTISLLV